LEWAAPQDLTCEVAILQRTELSVREHQRRTVDNFVELQMLWGDDNPSPFMPVIKGVSPGSSLRCFDRYGCAGIDVARYPVVGIGSVCRRQGAAKVDAIVSGPLRRDPGLPMHVFEIHSPKRQLSNLRS
jgi:hypothetical protein